MNITTNTLLTTGANRCIGRRPANERLRREAMENFYVALVICAIGWAQDTSFPHATQASVGQQSPAPSLAPSGQHDFDFHFGTWKAHNLLLAHPLSGSTTWIELNGTVTVRKLWDGRATMRPAELDEFSIVWNTDVKAGLVGIQAALNAPMKRGGRVLVMSSGAAMVLEVPFIKPDDLSLSGGYIGAKRMLWFMAHSANKVSRDRYLGIHFQVLAPLQLIPGTTLGHEAAAACAEIVGVSIEELVMQRYGSILRPAQIGEQVAEILGNPRYLQGLAYSFRNDCDLQPLEL